MKFLVLFKFLCNEIMATNEKALCILHCFHTCDKQVLWESAGAFFSATTHFTRQVAHFMRSWSSGKMLAFQPRGFVFNPWVCAYFFTSIAKQKVLTFFGTMRLFGFVRLFSKFFKCPQRVLLSFF